MGFRLALAVLGLAAGLTQACATTKGTVFESASVTADERVEALASRLVDVEDQLESARAELSACREGFVPPSRKAEPESQETGGGSSPVTICLVDMGSIALDLATAPWLLRTPREERTFAFVTRLDSACNQLISSGDCDGVYATSPEGEEALLCPTGIEEINRFWFAVVDRGLRTDSELGSGTVAARVLEEMLKEKE